MKRFGMGGENENEFLLAIDFTEITFYNSLITHSQKLHFTDKDK